MASRAACEISCCSRLWIGKAGAEWFLMSLGPGPAAIGHYWHCWAFYVLKAPQNRNIPLIFTRQ